MTIKHAILAGLVLASVGCAADTSSASQRGDAGKGDGIASVGDLTGTFSIRGENLGDAPEGEKTNTHLGLELTGAAAKALYDAMEAPVEEDACLGVPAKTVGNIKCTKNGSNYGCDFSINIKANQVHTGLPC